MLDAAGAESAGARSADAELDAADATLAEAELAVADAAGAETDARPRVDSRLERPEFLREHALDAAASSAANIRYLGNATDRFLQPRTG